MIRTGTMIHTNARSVKTSGRGANLGTGVPRSEGLSSQGVNHVPSRSHSQTPGSIEHSQHPVVVIVAWCIVAFCLLLLSGCQEVETVQRELLKKFRVILKQKAQFVPRDGMTIRPCSLYQTANPNSEVIRRLPAEAAVHLVDKVGDWYRVRTRDGREGYLELKMVGGQELIQQTQELRRSIEGIPPQAEGITKSRANFRLQPGREHEVIEVLPPGKKFEVFDRVVTLRSSSKADKQSSGSEGAEQPGETSIDTVPDDPRKDVWYKVKIEDGRVGYIYTHNMKLTPPEDLARMVPYMRMVAWQSVNVTEDPDRGPQNNYLVAFAPMGKDPGCDYTHLYLMSWSTRLQRRIKTWEKTSINGILPITSYLHDSNPGFSVRYLHPTKKDRLVLINYVLSRGQVRAVGEEEVPSRTALH